MKALVRSMALLFVAGSVYAQTLTESMEVRVLEVEAVVIDSRGKPVSGLKRGDFEVRVDGKPAEVTNFFAVDRGIAVDETPASAPDEEQIAPQHIPSHLIVFVDDLHLRQAARKRVLDALKKYIETSMEPSTSVTIIRWNGTARERVRTKDRQRLLREIGQLEREPALMIASQSERQRVMRLIDDVILHPTPMQAIDARIAFGSVMHYAEERKQQVENTVAALMSIVTLSSTLDGRKVLLYVSEGLPVQPGAEMIDYAIRVFTRNPVDGLRLEDTLGGRQVDSVRYDQTRTFQALASVALSAGVVFSALDPGGVRSAEGAGVEYGNSLTRLDAALIRENASAGPRMIARETGGRFIENENNLDHAVSVLTGEVSTYYSIGVKPPAKRAANITVRVRGRDDLRVLTPKRRAIKSAAEAIEIALRARLYSRDESNPLDVRIAMGAPWPRDGKCVASVQLMLPVERLTLVATGLTPAGELEVHAMALDDRGVESRVHSSTHPVANDNGPLTVPLMLGFRPRRYVISFAIVDKLSGTTSYLQATTDASICGK
jgi:VWFA-related protein